MKVQMSSKIVAVVFHLEDEERSWRLVWQALPAGAIVDAIVDPETTVVLGWDGPMMTDPGMLPSGHDEEAGLLVGCEFLARLMGELSDRNDKDENTAIMDRLNGFRRE